MNSRPKSNDDNVRKLAIENLFQKVLISYFKEDGIELDEEFIKEAKGELFLATKYEHDAYDICKRLENNFYWNVDSDLVHSMEAYFSYQYDAHNKLVKEWVKENNIQLKYFEGDEVTYKNAGMQIQNGKLISNDHYGKIICRDHKKATYTVFSEHLGHVEYGVGTHGRIVNCEDIIDLK